VRFALAIVCLALPAAPLLAADDAFTAAKARQLIPEAAGMPAKELKGLAESPTVGNFRPSRGDSLTWFVLNYAPDPKGKLPTSFRFIGEAIDPARIAGALAGPKGKDRKYASLIHPEYITDCTCEADGDTATGTVSFKAEKAYEGKVEYTARKKNGAWRIEEFRLPDLKVTLALGADGKWVKK
jgi:hypothetical protein